MAEDRIHRTTSADGTRIAGRVVGSGPPLLFVHGILCDGDIWAPLIPCLADSFTCYLLNTRGRGLSDEGADLSAMRRLEDVLAFAESIGESVGVVGHSLGGQMALIAAARSERIATVAVYEPSVPELLVEGGAPDLKAGFERMAEIAGEGRPADAAEAFFAQFTSRDELDGLRRAGLLDQTGRNVAIDLRAVQQQSGEPLPPLGEALGRLAVPLLLLKGAESSSWFQNGVQYVAGQVPDAHVHEFEDCGHFGPVLAPEAVAATVREFFRRDL